MGAEIFIRNVLILSSAVLFAACQGTQDAQDANDPPPVSQTRSVAKDAPEADRERLLTRVREYWESRIQHDTKTAFQYEHPVRRKQLSEEVYLASMKPNIKILEYAILDVELPPQAHEAAIPLRLQYEYTFPQPGVKSMQVPTQVTDYWEKDQGVWYHVLDTNVIPRGKPYISRQERQDEQNAADSGKTG